MVSATDFMNKADELFGKDEPKQDAGNKQPGNGQVDLRAYLAHHGISYKVKGNGTKTIYALDHCVFDSSHVNNDAAFFQDAQGMLGYKCFHDSCQGKGWKDARQVISGDAPMAAFMVGGAKQNNKTAAIPKKDRVPLDVCAINFTDLLTMDIPERAKLFDWLPEGGIIMVYGPRGIGKTFFTLSLAGSLVSGAPFLKWGEPSKTVGVLIVDGEMALSDLRARFTKLLIQQPVAPLQIISSEVAFAKTEHDINFVDDAQRDDILNILDANKGIRLVIIDNISCLFSGLRESSKDDWEQVTPWLLAMRRRGVAVVLVHHAGKGGDQRGTSGREDMLDTVVRLDRVAGISNDGARFIVRFTKSRGAYGDCVKSFEASLDLDSPELWTWKPLEESNYERMLVLAGEGITSVTDMAEELGISKGMVSRLKKQGIDKGDLVRGTYIKLVDGGGSDKPANDGIDLSNVRAYRA